MKNLLPASAGEMLRGMVKEEFGAVPERFCDRELEGLIDARIVKLQSDFWKYKG